MLDEYVSAEWFGEYIRSLIMGTYAVDRYTFGVDLFAEVVVFYMYVFCSGSKFMLPGHLQRSGIIFEYLAMDFCGWINGG